MTGADVALCGVVGTRVGAEVVGVGAEVVGVCDGAEVADADAGSFQLVSSCQRLWCSLELQLPLYD